MLRKQWLTLAATALLCGALLHIVRADEVEDELDKCVRDSTQVQIDNSYFQYEAESSAGFESKLKVMARGDTDGEKSFRIAYEFAGSGKNTRADFEHKFKVRFFSIIEYTEASSLTATSTDGFNSTDTVVKNYTVTSWGDWNENTPSGASYRKWILISSDNVVTVNLYITTTSNATLPSGVTIDANSAKFDFIINGFTYASTDNSFLAVAARVETETDCDSDDRDNKLTTKGTGAAIEGVFTWSTTVQATSTANAVSTVAVIPSKFTSNKRSRLGYFAFNAVQPKKIEWDPEVTIKSTGTGSLPKSAAGAMFNSFALIALVAIAAFLGL